MPALFFDNGTQGTINVKWPDVLRPYRGIPVATYFNYDTTTGTAAVFSQTVNGSKDTRVLAMGFPFETIYPDSIRNKVMETVYKLFTKTLATEVRERDERAISVTYPYPNPFTGESKITLTLPAPELVSVILYDVLGRAADTLCYREQKSGVVTFSVNGSKLSSGVYWCRINIGEKQYMRKLVMMK